jgi:dTDP-4-dehydrorhamnose reductase
LGERPRTVEILAGMNAPDFLAGRRVVVTGANGMLGAEFAEALEKAGADVARASRPDIDLDRPETASAFLRAKAGEVVFHCAAETNVDACERELELAFRRNRDFTRAVAETSRELSAKLVFVSSSGIFDGKKHAPYDEFDSPAPCTVYAQSKVAAEEMLRTEFPEALIVRAGWLFGGAAAQKKNFVAARWREAQGKAELVSASDKIGSPTWTRDLVRQVLRLIEIGASGVFHTANEEPATRADYVAEILRVCGLSTKVRPVSSREFPRSAPVPDNESLTSVRITEVGLSRMRPWKEALTEYAAEMSGGFSV